MPTNFDPRIGDWYRTADGDTFEIVARDELEGTWELQYFDGTLDEVDTTQWDEMLVEPIDPPEDWHGALDIDVQEDTDDLEVNRMIDGLNRQL